MIKQKINRNHYVVCISDSEPELEIRKIYQMFKDRIAQKEGYIRIVDESGEDYLYPSNYSMEIKLPKKNKKSLSLV